MRIKLVKFIYPFYFFKIVCLTVVESQFKTQMVEMSQLCVSCDSRSDLVSGVSRACALCFFLGF